MLYMANVYVGRQLMNVRVYENYEHVISDIIDKDSDLYSNVQAVTDDMLTDFRIPGIHSVSLDCLGYHVDFVFRYPNGVSVRVESVTTAESFERDVRHLNREKDGHRKTAKDY